MVNSAYTNAHYVWPTITVICTILVLATAVNSLVMARRNPGNITNAVILHGFVVLMAAGLGATQYFQLSYYVFYTQGVAGEGLYELAGDAMDKAVIAKGASWFSIIVTIGALLGAVSIVIRKMNNPNKP